MSKKNSIKLFEDKLVRSVWDDEKEEWYFCVNDVIQLITDTVNVNSYLKTLRNKDEELSKGWLQIVTTLSVETAEGKKSSDIGRKRSLCS